MDLLDTQKKIRPKPGLLKGRGRIEVQKFTKMIFTFEGTYVGFIHSRIQPRKKMLTHDTLDGGTGVLVIFPGGHR